jgi:hypothetical protein
VGEPRTRSGSRKTYRERTALEWIENARSLPLEDEPARLAELIAGCTAVF